MVPQLETNYNNQLHGNFKQRKLEKKLNGNEGIPIHILLHCLLEATY